MNVTELTGLFFLDTNILIYSLDSVAQQKQQSAQEIIQFALQSQRGVISTQVVQEFLNVALRKFSKPMSITEARTYLHAVLMPLVQHRTSIPFYDNALTLQMETGYSWYDSLVMAAAIELGCTYLLSEDLQHGRVIQGMTIFNPFTEDAR